MNLKAQDLRIGNFVYVNNDVYHPKLTGIPLEVTGISENRDVDGSNTHSISLKHINQKKNTYYETYSQFIRFIDSIPLTKEWLIKLGFYLHGTTVEGNDIFRKIYDDGHFDLEKIIGYYYGGNFTCVNLEYVHQLQNLYHAITVEELILKL